MNIKIKEFCCIILLASMLFPANMTEGFYFAKKLAVMDTALATPALASFVGPRIAITVLNQVNVSKVSFVDSQKALHCPKDFKISESNLEGVMQSGKISKLLFNSANCFSFSLGSNRVKPIGFLKVNTPKESLVTITIESKNIAIASSSKFSSKEFIPNVFLLTRTLNFAIENSQRSLIKKNNVKQEVFRKLFFGLNFKQVRLQILLC